MNLRRPLFEVYWKMEKVIAPGLRYSQSVYEEVLNEAVQPGVRWLDVGCGHRVLPEWRTQAEMELVARAGRVAGVDPDASAIGKHRSLRDVQCASAEKLPFEKASFDLVTANMVVEHLADPPGCIGEVRRVLAPGGLFIFHTPNALGHSTLLARLLPDVVKQFGAKLLDGRPSDDVYRTFYRLNSAPRVNKLAADQGWEVVGVRQIPTSAMFAVLAPLALMELFWIRWTMSEAGAKYRTNLIVTLRRPLALPRTAGHSPPLAG